MPLQDPIFTESLVWFSGFGSGFRAQTPTTTQEKAFLLAGFIANHLVNDSILVSPSMPSMGLDCESVKVTAIPDILARGVMSMPAMAVDAVLKVQEHVPTSRNIGKRLQV